MPTLEQHKNKYQQNRKLLNNELNIEDCTVYDWIVTVAFYAAMHLIEGDMAKSDIHTRTHTDRGIMVARNRNFINIRSKYKTLHDRSIVARYGGQCLDKRKAQQALQLLAEIEKEIVL